MLEGVLAEVLTRVLGQYVRGITRDSINFGVWRGDLELRNLELHAEALGVLFETLGLDLPITVTEGYVGLLRLEVPWKRLRTQPVRVVLDHVTVLASPSAQADKQVLAEHHLRLKRARLETDDALREARWSAGSFAAERAAPEDQTSSWSSGWGWSMTNRMVAKIIDNLQVSVSDIIIQYEDCISYPEKPFIARLLLDAVHVRSTDSQWQEVFLDDTAVDYAYKKVDMAGLSLEWLPRQTEVSPSREGSSSEALRRQLLSRQRRDGDQVISPVEGCLLAALRKPSALDEPENGRFSAKVNISLSLPSLNLALNEFQYGTLLRMIWFMESSQQKGSILIRSTARDRWNWAMNQILPNFEEHFRLAWLHTPAGMREQRERMLAYLAKRLPVLRARRSGKKISTDDLAALERIEDGYTFEECCRFREVAEFEYSFDQTPRSQQATRTSYFASVFTTQRIEERGDPDDHLSIDSYPSEDFQSALGESEEEDSPGASLLTFSIRVSQCGISLSHGGDDGESTPFSKLVLTDLCLGFETKAGNGSVFEGVLGEAMVIDCASSDVVLGARDSRGSAAPRTIHDQELFYPENVVEVLENLRNSCVNLDPAHELRSAKEPGITTLSRSASSSWFGSYASTDDEINLENNEPTPIPYIAALRVLRDVELGGDASCPRMDLAIGGLQGTINGPDGSFVESFNFWTPKSQPEQLISFLNSVATAGILALRLKIQQTLLAREKPLEVHIAVHAPRFIIPGNDRNQPALIVDLGRFKFDTVADDSMSELNTEGKEFQHTSYRMESQDTGVYLVESIDRLSTAQCLMRPSSVNLAMRVLQDASLVSAAAAFHSINAAKTSLSVEIPAIQLLLHQKSYRKLLKLARTWSSRVTEVGMNAVAAASTFSMSETDSGKNELQGQDGSVLDLNLSLTLGEAAFELRDRLGKKLMLARAIGTALRVEQGTTRLSVKFRSSGLDVIDGTRGTPAPYRRLVCVGIHGRSLQEVDDLKSDEGTPIDMDFVEVDYTSEFAQSRQYLRLHFLALSLICMREACVALARFLFEVEENAFRDPLNEAGMSWNSAATVIKEHGSELVERSVTAISRRGHLHIDVVAEGAELLIATSDGAVAKLSAGHLKGRLVEGEHGDFLSEGSIGSVHIQNLSTRLQSHRHVLSYNKSNELDGWNCRFPSKQFPADSWVQANFCGLRAVFVQKFLRIVRHYFTGLSSAMREFMPTSRENIDWGEIFSPVNVGEPNGDGIPLSMRDLPRLRVDIHFQDLDCLVPRNSQDNLDAIRLFIPSTRITNKDTAAEGYKIGFEITSENICSAALYPDPKRGIEPFSMDTPFRELRTVMEGTAMVVKVDWWRKASRTAGVDAQFEPPADGDDALVDMHYRLPSLRARCFLPDGYHTVMSEADYSVIYLVLTENLFERIDEDDLVQANPNPNPEGVLMPPLVRVLFNFPVVTGVLARGTDASNPDNWVTSSQLCDVFGRVEYGSDFRLSVAISGNVGYVKDFRRFRKSDETIVVGRGFSASLADMYEEDGQDSRVGQDIDFSYDRGFQQRANIMIVVSDLAVAVVPELSLLLGDLTIPGNPFLPTTSFPEFPYFNGRTLIVTVSNTRVVLGSKEFDNDTRAMIFEGNLVAKVFWAKETRERSMEFVGSGVRVSLTDSAESLGSDLGIGMSHYKTALLYPCDLNFAMTSDTMEAGVSSILLRVAIQDAPLLVWMANRINVAVAAYRADPKEHYVDIPVAIFGDQDVTSVAASIASARVVFTDERESRFVPILEMQALESTLEGRLPWMLRLTATLSADLFDDLKGWWVPGMEPWSLEVVASQGRSGARAIAARAQNCLNLNFSTVTCNGTLSLVKTVSKALRELEARPDQRSVRKLAASLSRRPSVAAFCVRNETGRPMLVWLPNKTTKTQLHSGNELEIDIDADQLISPGARTGKDREAIMRCVLSLSGFEPVIVSAAEIGVTSVNFAQQGAGVQTFSVQPVWDVSMRDGVPCGVLRSPLRYINKTESELEIASAEDAPGISIKPGDEWCVPLNATEEHFRVRPASKNLFLRSVDARFHWSDALPSTAELQKIAKELGPYGSRDGVFESMAPVVLCRGVLVEEEFCLSIVPQVDLTGGADDASSWLDIFLFTPLVVQNLLPRSLSLCILKGSTETIISRLLPSRECHVSEVGPKLKDVSFKFSYSNVGEDQSQSWGKPVLLTKGVTNIQLYPATAAQRELLGQAERISSPGCQHVRVYSLFWVRNRSDVDLELRDRGSGDPRSTFFLRSRPPSTQPDPFVCFSGQFVDLRRRDGAGVWNQWHSVGTDLSATSKPIYLELDGSSVVVDVRHAKGRYRRSLIVTIRTAFWLENRTDQLFQWCHRAGLNKRGIVLQSAVHQLAPQEQIPVHFEKGESGRGICLRPSLANGESDWIWSMPLPMSFHGEMSTKMYRPKTHDQYIARANRFSLPGGSIAVRIYPEDREHPPYRLVNNCRSRSIAFRQVGSDKAHPWLIRPGKNTRYSWDDPQASRSKKALIIEVIENQDGREVSRPEFRLNIDIVTGEAERMGKHFHPALLITIEVDGATKLVKFEDEKNGAGSLDDAGSPGVPVLTWDVIEGAEVPEEEAPEIALDVEIWLDSVGISLIDDRATEIAYLRASGLRLHVDQMRDSQVALFEVRTLQVDNQLADPVWPVWLWAPNQNAGLGEEPANPATRQRSVLQFVFERTGGDLRGITMCKAVYVSLQHLQVAVEEEFAMRIWDFFKSLEERQFIIDESLEGDDMGVRRNCASDEQVSRAGLHRVYIEKLLLGPVKLTASFAASRATQDRGSEYHSLMRTLVAVLGNVENAELRFNALELHHAFDAIEHMQDLIREYYMSQLLDQRLALVASNSLLGNPSALFDSIAIGAKDFFYEPAAAKSGLDFIASVGRGSHSLLTNTVGGIFGSLGEIPRAVGRGLESVSGDQDYLSERLAIRGNQRSSSASQGLMTGAMSFGHGIASGAAGLIRDPIEGAIASGATGFFKGLGTGVVGGVLKPLTGAMDLISEPAAGLRNMMVGPSGVVAEPSRPPRFIRNHLGGRLLPYDFKAALGNSLLDAVARGDKLEHEHVATWIELTDSSTRSTPNRTHMMWMVMRRFTRGDGFLGRLMKSNRAKGPDGRTLKPEKDRIALITTKRVLIVTLEARLVSEYDISNVTDSRISGQAPDLLLLGTRNGGISQESSPTTWHKIYCGSHEAREEFDVELQKEISKNRMQWISGQLEGSFELPDMHDIILGTHRKSDEGQSDGGGPEVELKDLSKRPGDLLSDISARFWSKTASNANTGRVSSMEGRVAAGIRRGEQHNSTRKGRSVYCVVENRLDYELRLRNRRLDFGEWTVEAPEILLPESVNVWKADGSKDSSRDLRGFVIYGNDSENARVLLGFVNPLLAANSFPIRKSSGVEVWSERGHGSHAIVVFSVANEIQGDSLQTAGQSLAPRSEVVSAGLRSLTDAEESNLGLFATSEAGPARLTSSATSTMIVRQESRGSEPKNTDLVLESKVEKLVELGFVEQDAREGLEECDNDIVKTINKLTAE